MTEESVPTSAASNTNVAEVKIIPGALNRPILISKIFIGAYLLIFGWMFVHSILAFWDLLIPWNITLTQYLRFYGAFLIYILLLGFSTWYYWKIWSTPEWSVSNATRWPLSLSNIMALMLLMYSKMVDEPFPRIGSGWFIDDLRYPAFLSQPYNFLLLFLFVSDAAAVFSCSDEEGKSNYLFRRWRPMWAGVKWEGWKENVKGIFALAYIYFGYWFVFLVVSRSWIERIILYIIMSMAYRSFCDPKTFFEKRQNYMLAFVPVYALVRGYYSYTEWMAYGSRLVFVIKLSYCLSQLVIFAGWYTDSTSKLGEWTMPFMEDENFVMGEEERIIVNPEPEMMTSSSEIKKD